MDKKHTWQLEIQLSTTILRSTASSFSVIREHLKFSHQRNNFIFR